MKGFTIEFAEEIKELVEMCLFLNANTPHDLFFDFSGHVGSFEIRIFFNGWKKDNSGVQLILRCPTKKQFIEGLAHAKSELTYLCPSGMKEVSGLSSRRKVKSPFRRKAA